MISRDADRKHATILALSLAVALALAACGGSSGTSASTSGNTAGTPGGSHSPAATQRTQSLQATPTPAATATPIQPIIVAGPNIADYVRSAAPGSQIIVPPGRYAPLTLTASDVQGPIVLVADVTGVLNGLAGAVTIDASSTAAEAAVTLSGIPADSAVILDGFTLHGGSKAGISVNSSPGTVIEDCTVEMNAGDGALFSGSDGSLLFNNLINNNGHSGVRALDSSNMEIINNTVFHNGGTGIVVGNSQHPAPNALVENNIINENALGIVVDAGSLTGYQGDYNLNTDNYGADTPIGAHDLNSGANPLFIFPSGTSPDLHLSASSPAIDAGDPATAADLVSWLQIGSTQEDGTPDCTLVDLGYHYPTTQACVAPGSTPTVVATKKKKTPTRTPTP